MSEPSCICITPFMQHGWFFAIYQGDPNDALVYKFMSIPDAIIDPSFIPQIEFTFIVLADQSPFTVVFEYK